MSTITSIDENLRSSFPPLDPNGQPFSMMLRGSSAELDQLRSLLTDLSTRELMMQTPLVDDKFDDDDTNIDGTNDNIETCDHDEDKGTVENQHTSKSETIHEHDSHNSCKRPRDNADNEEEEDFSNGDTIENLLLYLPTIQCNCPLWGMKNVIGDLLVTSIRVLFVAINTNETDNETNCNDIAIDGRCIALHAIDSTSDDPDVDVLPHVYCQLSDPDGCENNGISGSTAFGMGASTIMDENSTECDNEEELNEEDGSSEDNGIIEVYFKPMICEHIKDRGEHAEACQKLFLALTKLASLNPADDDDDGYGGGGGLFNMLSLMAGMGGNGFGDGTYDDADDNDDMVIRFDDSDNLVDDDGSEGAPENERQAMLNRLDDLLVVPPEYEIPSEDDGQFDDAEDDDDLL